MFRNPWFWITITIIAIGVALTSALGVFYWLVGALAVAVLTLIIAFLAMAYAVGRAERPQVPHLQKIPHSERIPVIYDCDVTMGRPFQDVGDGLALLYLLGEPHVHLRAVTTTYGNGPTEMTTRMTRRLLDSLGYENVATMRGATGPDDDPETNLAAQHLKDAINAAPGKIVLIATGVLTNLKHAAALDPDFFTKLRGLYLWGGVTEPLVWNGHQVMERNFSLDPEAAHLALHAECPITIATGQAGLTAIFRSAQFAALEALDDSVSRLIARKIRFWFALMRIWFQDGGFGMGDSIAALALTHPELFESEPVYVTSTHDDLRDGRLFVDLGRHGPSQLIRGVRDFDGFIMAHFAAWHRLGQMINVKRSKRQ
ncbi:MAG: nucleoside hydrolase [Chloroflexi bacterium]|nr:nucleoside hydrolase [Chloroflexota bacterium]